MVESQRKYTLVAKISYFDKKQEIEKVTELLLEHQVTNHQITSIWWASVFSMKKFCLGRHEHLCMHERTSACVRERKRIHTLNPHSQMMHILM